MKVKILSFLFALALSCSFSVQKANAQFIVNDPAHMGLNLVEWGTNASQWIRQINEMLEATRIREGLQKISQLRE